MQLSIEIVVAPPWEDYALLDSGDGKKLEQFGDYRVIRPESQAIWPTTTAITIWEQADARFERPISFSHQDNNQHNGEWVYRRRLPKQWAIAHDGIACWVRLTPFRHTGVFPEHSAHWPWIRQQVRRCSHQPPRVLVLFGYTGLTTLVAAQQGAMVCHVDASRPATRWAQENQMLSGCAECSIRWIVDDVMKFMHREVRRRSQYDLILLDPPTFGRGPKGEIWRLHQHLSALLVLCRQVLSPQAVGLLLHAYATNVSSLALGRVVSSALYGLKGTVAVGELILLDRANNAPLPTAIYARWTA